MQGDGSLRGWLLVHAHRILEHLTVAKTRLGIVRRGMRSGDLDLRAAQAHLDQADRQIDVATAAMRDVRVQVENLADER